MKEQFEIKITINYVDDNISLETESQFIDDKNPSIYFLALSRYFHKQVLSGLEVKIKLADEMADLIKLCMDNGIDGSEEE